MESSYQALQEEFNQPRPNLARLQALLQDTRRAMAACGLISVQPNTAAPAVLMARDILEMGAYCDIHCKDVVGFDRHMQQLDAFYFSPALEPSSRMQPLLGLYLLHLLMAERSEELHLLLGRISSPVKQGPFVQFVVRLEQCLVEGTYNQVVEARNHAPAPEYTWFVDALMDTVRREIAACLERAFTTLHVSRVIQLLFLPDATDITQWLQSQTNRGWGYDSATGVINFRPGDSLETPAQHLKSMAHQMIIQSLEYARELEVLV